MRLSRRCYAVTGLGYSTPWCVNAGFITGAERTLVVDTGGNALGAATIHGYALAASPANPLRVINTEKHFDHIGGNSYFKALGVEIWGHRLATRTPAEFQAEIEEFNEGIRNHARRNAHEAKAFFYATELMNPDRQIAADMQLDLGGCPVHILLTPGHTESNLCVWVPEEGVLFTGDCLINQYMPNLDAGSPADWQTWLDSIARVRALQPETVVCGHGPVARGAEVERMIAAVQNVLQEAISVGRSPTCE